MALNVESVRKEMARLGVIPLKGDFTAPNPVISRWLKRFRKAGVPMYVVIPADSKRDLFLLGELITPGTVADALRDAAGESGR